MVCLRGESLTHHTNQMKLFNAIAAAAVIGTSLITATPAEARNGWIYAAQGSENSHYIKKLGYQGPFVKFQWKATGKGGWDYIHLADCNGWKERDINYTSWKEALPGTVADSVLEAVCL